MVSIVVVLVGKQAANQASVSNPHSPPGSTGSVTDTNMHLLALLRGCGEEKAGGKDEDEEEHKEAGFGMRWGSKERKRKKVAAEAGIL